MTAEASSGWGRVVDKIEETNIAVTLALMTIITFANVVARYVFESNILWGLEATVFLFAWLILVGASYGVKTQFHIGVDVVTNLMPPPLRRATAIFAVGACLAFSFLLLFASWDYWAPFIGRRAFLETEDIPMPGFLAFLADVLNEGEEYEKLPRFIPYFALPFGMALLTLRFLQVAWRVVTGRQESIIASHEAEEALEEAAQHRAQED